MGSPLPSPFDTAQGAVPAVKELVGTDLVGSTRLLSIVGEGFAKPIAASGSKDPSILDPWVRSLVVVGRGTEARAQAATSLGPGYREPAPLALRHRWNLVPREGETPEPS